MRMLTCLVTDGTAYTDAGRTAVMRRVHMAARAGVDLIQVREGALSTRALAGLVRACLALVHGTRTRLLVNDRLDVALATGAHGVHLRGDSMPPPRVRAVTPPGFLIGRSVHAVDEALAVAAAGGLDYVLFGTTFATASKPERRPAGLGLLAAVVSALPLPVLAIGGITCARIEQVRRTGAAGVAGIGLFADPDGIAAVVAAARARMERPESPVHGTLIPDS